LPDNFRLIKRWIEEYFSKCNLRRTFEEEDELFLITGHRGSPTFEAENTFASLERALYDGANSLEVDLCLTKDNEVVLWHDWNPDSTNAILREAGLEPFVKYKPHFPRIGSKYRKRINDLTIEEFRENFAYRERHDEAKIINPFKPKLSEFFEWCVEQKKIKYIFLDVKTPVEELVYSIPVIEEIKRLIDKFTPAFKIVIESEQRTVFKLLRMKYPGLSISCDIEPRAGLILMPRQYSAVKKAIKYKNEIAIALRPRKITVANWTTYRRIMKYDARLKYLFNKRHPERKIDKLIAATVNKTEELECLVKLGVGGIQTDVPHHLKEIALRYGRTIENEMIYENKIG
jgi:glycerophosphoryl diester phosphodiesterase